jgi:hypothetical protein
MAELEREIERYLVKRVAQIGGKAYKFVSPSNRGVSDRIVCLPDGTTHFIELKRPGGKVSPLQRAFMQEMAQLNQNYEILWSKEEVDQWISDHTSTTQPTSSSPTTGS